MKLQVFAVTAVAVLLLLTVSNTGIFAQACPSINAGLDTTLPCGTNCYQLDATVSQTATTTAYLTTQIGYVPYSFTAGTTVLLNVDDQWTSILNLNFNFCFYGNVYNQIVIGSNGLISFDLSYANQYNEWVIATGVPGNTDCLNSIMAPFHDIDPSVGGTIKYEYYGIAPCRAFVVSYYQVPMFQCNNLLATQQIVLYETTNVIDTYIENKPNCTTWNGAAAIHAIQNANGTQATVVPGRNYPTQWLAGNDAWRFTPDGPSNTTIEWYDEQSNLIASTDTVTICPNSTTYYVAQATFTNCDSNQVVVTDTINISVIADFNLSAVVNDALCQGLFDGSATVSASGNNTPYSYQWDANAGNQTTSTATGLTTGTYYITVTDSSGCSKDTMISVLAVDSVVGNILSFTDSICYGAADGSATVNATGGSLPYSYLWDDTNNQTTAAATGLSAGTYMVIITDSAGCMDTLIITIDEYDSLILAITAVDSVLCNGGSDGQSTVGASGGSGQPYTYQWDSNAGNQTSQTATGLSAGTYTVIVTDSIGCSDSITVTVYDPLGMILSANSIDASCYGGNDGQASVSANNGPPPYAYQWSSNAGNQTSQTATGVSAGTYTVTVTDDDGCTKTISVAVGQPAQFNVDFLANPSQGIAPLDVTFENNSSGAWFVWDFGDGETDSTSSPKDQQHTYGEPGTYEVTLTVYDANGCVGSKTIIVEVIQASDLNIPNIFSPNADGINDKFVIDFEGMESLHGIIFNRWGRKIYEWDNDNFWDGKGNNAGVYYYVVTANGIDGKVFNKTGYLTMVK